MTHDCPECGLGHDAPVAEIAPEPVVTESGPNENDVKIAEIEADTAVKVAKIEADVAEDDLRGEVESLRGEVRGMREVLDRIAPPEPEPTAEPPAPVVVEPEPAAPDVPPPPADEPKHREPKKKSGMFGF